jgi:hypothetical protein
LDSNQSPASVCAGAGGQRYAGRKPAFDCQSWLNHCPAEAAGSHENASLVRCPWAGRVSCRFPNLNQVVPKKRPLFTFRVDPKTLAETLLAMADLLPDEDRAVQFFYYGDGQPVGFCARNAQTGMMIDALVVPLTIPKPAATDKATQDRATEGQPQEAEEPKPNGRRRKKDEPEPAPAANGQARRRPQQ